MTTSRMSPASRAAVARLSSAGDERDPEEERLERHDPRHHADERDERRARLTAPDGTDPVLAGDRRERLLGRRDRRTGSPAYEASASAKKTASVQRRSAATSRPRANVCGCAPSTLGARVLGGSARSRCGKEDGLRLRTRPSTRQRAAQRSRHFRRARPSPREHVPERHTYADLHRNLRQSSVGSTCVVLRALPGMRPNRRSWHRERWSLEPRLTEAGWLSLVVRWISA